MASTYNRRLCLISDTHGSHKDLDLHLEGVDFLCHAGDLTTVGKEHEVRQFNEWCGELSLPKERIIVIAGNHDFWFEHHGLTSIHEMCTNFTYLEQELYEFDGVKFYGAPHQPRFGGWAFNVDRGNDIKKIWDRIPDDTDVLITHGPPQGILDMTASGNYAGCEELRVRTDELQKLKVHVFGHIHESQGFEIHAGNARFINASIMNLKYQPVNHPFYINITV